MCLFKLPNALMAYNKSNEIFSSIENMLKSVEIALSNKFNTLTTQVNGLSSKIIHSTQDIDAGMATDITIHQSKIHLTSAPYLLNQLPL